MSRSSSAFPLAADSACFIVGQNARGEWLAVESHKRGGGLFKSKRDALHFVDLETGHRPGAVRFATAPLQLKF